MEEQDTMMIRTSGMKNLLSNLLRYLIKKKTGGRQMNISIDELEVKNVNGEFSIKTSISAKMSTVEFFALMEQLNS